MSNLQLVLSLLGVLGTGGLAAFFIWFTDQQKKLLDPVPPVVPPPVVDDELWDEYRKTIDSLPDHQFIQRDFNADDVDDLAIAHVVALYKANKPELCLEALQLALKQKVKNAE